MCDSELAPKCETGAQDRRKKKACVCEREGAYIIRVRAGEEAAEAEAEAAAEAAEEEDQTFLLFHFRHRDVMWSKVIRSTARFCNATQREARQGEATQRKATWSKVMRSKGRQDKVGQGKARQYEAVLCLDVRVYSATAMKKMTTEASLVLGSGVE